MNDAHTITKALGGDWCGRYGLIPGPGHSARDRSLKVVDGEDGVICHSFAGDDWQACRDWLRDIGLIGEAKPASAAVTPRQRRDDDKWQRAMDIWTDAKPGQGTLAETYLGNRGISLPVPASLRFAMATKHPPTGLWLPAMIAAVQTPSRMLGAIHRTFLKMDGTGKAEVSTPRMALGPLKGNAVRLAKADTLVALCEGIEDSLALMQMTGAPCWAVLGTSGFLNVELPDHISRVILAPDNDPAGKATIERAANRLTDLGKDVGLKLPPAGSDWCDMLAEFEERAAIAEHDGGLPRQDAENLAWESADD